MKTKRDGIISMDRDHRKAPQRCYPMLGFKTFGNAEVTLRGIELADKIKKGSSITVLQQCLSQEDLPLFRRTTTGR
jgi:hypothetical protein